MPRHLINGAFLFIVPSFATIYMHGFLTFLAILLSIIGFGCLYYAVAFFKKDIFVQIFISVSTIVFLSGFRPSWQPSSVIICLIFCFFIFICKPKETIELVCADLKACLTLPFFDVLTYLILLFSICLSIKMVNGDIYLRSTADLAYLSQGYAFHDSFFYTKDLAYHPKPYKTNFWGLLLPSFFENILPISLLHSVYLVSKIWLVFPTMIFLSHFLNFHLKFKKTLLTIIFLPIYYPETLGGFIVNPSSGNLLGFLYLGLCIEFLISGRIPLLVLSACFLMLSKMPFILTFSGGCFFYYLRKRDYRSLAIIMVLLGTMFIINLILFFYSPVYKARLHFLFFPQYLYYLFRTYYSHFGVSAFRIFTVKQLKRLKVSSKWFIICCS